MQLFLSQSLCPPAQSLLSLFSQRFCSRELLQLMKDCVGDWEPASGWALYWTDLLRGRSVFSASLHFGGGWHILFPFATLGMDSVGFNNSNPGQRCQSLRDCSVLCHRDPPFSLSLQPIEKLVALLNTLDRWIDETPPVDQPSRFGNKAFRTWYAKLDQVSMSFTCSVRCGSCGGAACPAGAAERLHHRVTAKQPAEESLT